MCRDYGSNHGDWMVNMVKWVLLVIYDMRKSSKVTLSPGSEITFEGRATSKMMKGILIFYD